MSKSKEPNIKPILVKLDEYNSKNNVEKIIETIEELKKIEIDGKKINLKDPIYDKYLKGYTLLYWICYYNLENLLDVLIDNYIDELDVDIKNEKTLHTSFHAACMVGNLEMFKKLYFIYHKKKLEKDNKDDHEKNDNKININKYLETHDKTRQSLCEILNTKTRDYCNSFYFACRYNHLHMIKYFYDTIGENNGLEEISKIKNNYQETPLNAACKYNYIKVVKFLLEKKLHRDINKGEIVKLRFVEEGDYKTPVNPDKIYYEEIDNNILDIRYSDVTPLHIATIYGNKEIIKLLVKHGSDVYKKIRRSGTKNKSTPYTLLCDTIHFIDLKDKNNTTLLNKYDEVIQLFIKNGWTKDSSLYKNGYCWGKERIHYAKKGQEYKNPLQPRSPSKSPSKSPTSSKRSTSKSPSKGGNSRKTRKIKSNIMQWLFAKKKPIDTFGLENVRDKTELDDYPFLKGNTWKVKGRKPKEIVVNMSFAPWEEGFRPPVDDPYDDGPYLDPKGRVIPRKYGTKGKARTANKNLAKKYDQNAEIIIDKEENINEPYAVPNPLHITKKKLNSPSNSATRRNSRSTSKKSPSKSKGGKTRKNQ